MLSASTSMSISTTYTAEKMTAPVILASSSCATPSPTRVEDTLEGGRCCMKYPFGLLARAVSPQSTHQCVGCPSFPEEVLFVRWADERPIRCCCRSWDGPVPSTLLACPALHNRTTPTEFIYHCCFLLYPPQSYWSLGVRYIWSLLVGNCCTVAQTPRPRAKNLRPSRVSRVETVQQSGLPQFLPNEACCGRQPVIHA